MKKVNKCLFAALMLFSTSFLLSMEYITVVTGDAQEIQLEQTVIENSKIVSDLLSNSTTEDVITLPAITTDVFIKIIPLLHLIDAARDVQTNSQIIIKRLLEENYGFETYVQLFNAANYLNCEPLLQACAGVLADLAVKGLKSYSLESLLQWISLLDIPQELSLMLGQKITEQNGFSPLITIPQEIATKIQETKITTFVYSHDKTLFAYAIQAEGIYVWNIVTQQMIKHIKRQERVYALAFSPDKSLLVEITASPTRSWDLMRIWETQSFKVLNLSPVLNNQHIETVSIAPDNKSLITNYPNSSFSVWSIEDEHEAFEMQRIDNKSINPIVFNKKGELVSSSAINTYHILIHSWYLKYPQLKHELNTLQAEQALFFIWIVQKIASGNKIKISEYPEIQPYYSILIQNQTIFNCISDYVIQRENICVIS